MKEIHRENEEQDPNKIEDDDEKIKQIIDHAQKNKQWTQVCKFVEEFFNQWNFDVFKYYDILKDKTLVHFGFKLFQTYGLIDKFQIADKNFKSLLEYIQSSFYDNC